MLNRIGDSFPTSYLDLYNRIKNNNEFNQLINNASFPKNKSIKLPDQYVENHLQNEDEYMRKKREYEQFLKSHNPDNDINYNMKKMEYEKNEEEQKNVKDRMRNIYYNDDFNNQKMDKNKFNKSSNTNIFQKISNNERLQNNKNINDYLKIDKEYFKSYNNKYPFKVFLSYSVKDILIGIMLFFFFKQNHVYLYVDYLCNDKTENTYDLKKGLIEQSRSSDQILLIDGRHCELTIDSSTYIRPWCSFENGSFISSHLNEYKKINKYKTKNLILFRLGWANIKDNKNGIKSNNVQMIHDMRIPTTISNSGLD